jgi:hypothetical protein
VQQSTIGVNVGPNGASGSAEARHEGRALRREKPPTWIADWRRPDDADPVAILKRVAEGRDQDLVKMRNKEMAASAFSFLRGAAAVMSADLAGSLTEVSGIELDICGDAHLANFGGFYSPERALVFDVNDFDEARVGPWEWDCLSACRQRSGCRVGVPVGRQRERGRSRGRRSPRLRRPLAYPRRTAAD